MDDSIRFFREFGDFNDKIPVYDEVHEVGRNMQKEMCDFKSNEKAML